MSRSKSLRRLCCFAGGVAAILWTGSLHAQSETQRLFEVDDLFEVEGVGRYYGGPYAFSADEQRLAYTRVRPKKTLSNFKWEYLWESEGIGKHPDDPRMYRHRGHRYITLRKFDQAIQDFQVAERLMEGRPIEIEPDGSPNPSGIPTTTLQSNVWYHLALAHYLKGDFELAIPSYLRILDIASNDDNLVASTDWLYMTYRRLGMEDDALRLLEDITEDMTILENHSYHRRLLMYKGLLTPQDLLDVDEPDPVQFATQGYGVGNWYFYNGDRDRAKAIFEQILQAGNWAAFGFIAAEAELAR